MRSLARPSVSSLFPFFSDMFFPAFPTDAEVAAALAAGDLSVEEEDLWAEANNTDRWVQMNKGAGGQGGCGHVGR